MICEICGKEFDKSHWYEPYDKICSSECFSKKFWIERIQLQKEDPNTYIVVDGVAYCIGKENKTNPDWNGFGGREFKIKRFGSDEVVVTHNLWSNGTVPEQFRNRLPNNAEFV